MENKEHFYFGCDIHWGNIISLIEIYRIGDFESKALFNHKPYWGFDTLNSE